MPSTQENDRLELEEEPANRSLVWPILLAGLFIGVAIFFLLRFYQEEAKDLSQHVDEAVAPKKLTMNKAENGSLRFREAAREKGIVFQHETGGVGKKLLPETMGSGAAFVDFDDDGDQDLVLVNSGVWEDDQGESGPTHKFFENRNGSFTDQTARVGLDFSCYGMGVVVGDYDQDGWPDLFMTAVGKNYLLRNVDGLRFEDVSEAAGVAGRTSWSSGAAFLDHDRDGDLDLLVLNYVSWSKEIDLSQSFTLGSLDRAFGPPTAFGGEQPFFYENQGDGTFLEVAEQIGLHVKNRATGIPVGKSLAVIVTDFDSNGWPDLVVANDTVRNFAFKNLGNGSFEEVGMELGLAFDDNGNSRGAMGMAESRFRNDGATAIAVGNFANEMTAFYVSEDDKDPTFFDDSSSVGVGAPSRDSLTFGLVFCDLDLDGFQDMAVANGHVEPDISRVQASQSHAQNLDIFRNLDGQFERLRGGDLESKFVGRGLAYADIDGDGDLDLLATVNQGKPRLLLNEQIGGQSVRLDLRLADGKRKAIGSTVEMKMTKGVAHRRLTTAGSYLSSNETIVTFGLGSKKISGEITITWPDGQIQKIASLPAGSHTLRQLKN